MFIRRRKKVLLLLGIAFQVIVSGLCCTIYKSNNRFQITRSRDASCEIPAEISSARNITFYDINCRKTFSMAILSCEDKQTCDDVVVEDIDCEKLKQLSVCLEKGNYSIEFTTGTGSIRVLRFYIQSTPCQESSTELPATSGSSSDFVTRRQSNSSTSTGNTGKQGASSIAASVAVPITCAVLFIAGLVALIILARNKRKKPEYTDMRESSGMDTSIPGVPSISGTTDNTHINKLSLNHKSALNEADERTYEKADDDVFYKSSSSTAPVVTGLNGAGEEGDPYCYENDKTDNRQRIPSENVKELNAEDAYYTAIGPAFASNNYEEVELEQFSENYGPTVVDSPIYGMNHEELHPEDGERESELEIVDSPIYEMDRITQY